MNTQILGDNGSRELGSGCPNLSTLEILIYVAISKEKSEEYSNDEFITYYAGPCEYNMFQL